MGCVIAVLAMITPRLLMVLIWVTSDWFSRAYETVIWPVLGFIFMPYTTLAYMAAMLNNAHRLSGWWLALFIVAIIADVGNWGGSGASHQKRKKTKDE
ncbi:MAG: hypothetical protein ACYTHN_24490 [Planctomycetota bacterium]|jgi:hypothetical protein